MTDALIQRPDYIEPVRSRFGPIDAILDSLPWSILLLDGDGRAVFSNRAERESLGVIVPDGSEFDFLGSVVPSTDAAELIERYRCARRAGADEPAGRASR
jgi:hypothetical protein